MYYTSYIALFLSLFTLISGLIYFIPTSLFNFTCQVFNSPEQNIFAVITPLPISPGLLPTIAGMLVPTNVIPLLIVLKLELWKYVYQKVWISPRHILYTEHSLEYIWLDDPFKFKQSLILKPLFALLYYYQSNVNFGIVLFCFRVLIDKKDDIFSWSITT